MGMASGILRRSREPKRKRKLQVLLGVSGFEVPEIPRRNGVERVQGSDGNLNVEEVSFPELTCNLISPSLKVVSRLGVVSVDSPSITLSRSIWGGVLVKIIIALGVRVYFGDPPLTATTTSHGSGTCAV